MSEQNWSTKRKLIDIEASKSALIGVVETLTVHGYNDQANYAITLIEELNILYSDVCEKELSEEEFKKQHDKWVRECGDEYERWLNKK